MTIRNLMRVPAWYKMPSIWKTCHSSTSKTKVVVDVEGEGLEVGECDTFIAGPYFFTDAHCRLTMGKGMLEENGKVHG